MIRITKFCLLNIHTEDLIIGVFPDYIKKGEHPKEGLEREVDEETGYVVSADTRLKIRTDRNNARLDITYAGVFIGGNYKPSKEITEAKFFRFEKLPILPQDQLVFIDEALRLRKLKTYLFNDSITTGV